MLEIFYATLLIYYTTAKKEDILLNELNQYSYRGTRLKTIIKENQVSGFVNLEEIFKFINRRAKTEFETKKIFKKLLDEANQEGFTSIRVLLDGSSLPLKNDNLIAW